MMRQKQGRLVVFALAGSILGSAAETAAQIFDPRAQNPGMPAQVRRDGKSDVMVITASAGGGIDNNGDVQIGDVRDPEFQGRQAFSDLNAGITYSDLKA